MTRFDAVAVPPAIAVADLPLCTFAAGGVEVAFPLVEAADVARVAATL